VYIDKWNRRDTWNTWSRRGVYTRVPMQGYTRQIQYKQKH
jgi:hypothetical protein